MKSLAQQINESFAINEAFKSPILAKLQQSNAKQFKQLTISGYAIKWSEIEDTDIEYIDDRVRLRKIAKTDNNAIILWVRSEEVIGASVGNWVTQSGIYRAGRRVGYSSVSAVSKDADAGYVIRGWKDSDIDGYLLRSERWASKMDAQEYKDNYQIASDNRERYQFILATNKANAARTENNIDEMVHRLMRNYMSTFEKMNGSSDWVRVKSLGEAMKKLTELYAQYIDAVNDMDTDKQFTFQLKKITDITKTISDAIAKLDAINAENAE